MPAGVVFAVVVFAVVVVAGSTLVAGCGDSGDEFVGEWTNDAVMGESVIAITRDGGDFSLRLPSATYEGRLDGEALVAPSDDPTMRITVRGEDLLMEFTEEGDSILLSRKGAAPSADD